MGSSSSSCLALVMACSGGLPSKAKGGTAPGGFSGTPYPVSDARAALNRRGGGEVLGVVVVDGEKHSRGHRGGPFIGQRVLARAEQRPKSIIQ
jgi:hypothetical protein